MTSHVARLQWKTNAPSAAPVRRRHPETPEMGEMVIEEARWKQARRHRPARAWWRQRLAEPTIVPTPRVFACRFRKTFHCYTRSDARSLLEGPLRRRNPTPTTGL